MPPPMPLDLRTLATVNLVIAFVGVIAIGILWGQHRRRYRGISYWLAAMILQVIANVLLVLRGTISDFLSIIVSNLAVEVGTWLFLVGLEQFFGRPRKHTLNLILLAAFLITFTYWSVVPNIGIRKLLVASCMAVLMAQAAWLLLVKVPAHHSATQMMGIIALGYVAANILRIIGQLIVPQTSNDFFQSNNVVDALAFVGWLTLTSLLLLTLVLMVNQRLLRDVRAQEEKFAKAFHSSTHAILLTRKDNGAIFEVNQGFEDITGYRREEVLHKTTTELHLWSSEDARKAFLTSLSQNQPLRKVEMEFRRKDGSSLIGILSAELIEIADETCVISSISDVTEQSRLRDQLKALALHDALTDLPNRRLFYDRFALSLANALRHKNRLAVISLDLDQFKTINDTYGHETGDLVLTETSRRLSQSVREVDTVARFGGDEFMILLWEIRSVEDAAEVAVKILEQFRVPFAVAERSMTAHASLGIALYPDHGTDLETLLRNSDQALYAVKAQGRNHYRLAGS
jgi:diguanylate cyclase (GGDEF)-like protein/PAS domain S-box-containing protein